MCGRRKVQKDGPSPPSRRGLPRRVGGVFRGPVFRVWSHASRFAQCLAQQKLDLPVQAAQVVVCPALQRLEQCWVDAEKECLAVRQSERRRQDEGGRMKAQALTIFILHPSS